MKVIATIICIFAIAGCATKTTQKSEVQSNSNLSGEWSYHNGRGSVTIVEEGKKVDMAFTWSGQGNPRPHYRLSAIKNGRQLVGTWKCVSKAVRDCTGESNDIELLVSNDGNSFTVVKATDPYRHGWNSKVVIYRGK